MEFGQGDLADDPHEQGGHGPGDRDTLAVNGIEDGYIRVVVTRGSGSLGLDPNRSATRR